MAWLFSAYTLALVQGLAQAPAAVFYLGKVAPWLVALFYLAFFVLTWLASRPAEQRSAWGKALADYRRAGGPGPGR